MYQRISLFENGFAQILNGINQVSKKISMSKEITSADIGHILQKVYGSDLNFKIEAHRESGFEWSITDTRGTSTGEGKSKDIEDAVWELCKAPVSHFPDAPKLQWLKEYLIEKNAETNQI